MLKISRSFFMTVVGIVFLAVAIFHATALYLGLSISVGDWIVPAWVRLLGIFVAFVLAIESVRYMR